MNAEFEKWAKQSGYYEHVWGDMERGWNARQPEINALSAALKNARLIFKDASSKRCAYISKIKRENYDLKAENERLRKAAGETLSCFDSSARYSQGFESSCERLRAALEGK